MADADTRLPVRALATDVTVEIANSGGATINPAKEDGNLASIQTSTASVDSKLNSLGQKTSAGSVPVVIASDQSTVPVSIAGDQNVNVDKYGGTSTTLGQKVSASSMPVVIASDQSAIPVTITETPSEGTEDYKHVTALAAAGTDTHSFTPGTTVLLDRVDASASGQIKVEVQWGNTGSETSKWVGFTSKGNLNCSMVLPNPVSITTAMTVKVLVTNTEPALAQDVYSTIFAH